MSNEKYQCIIRKQIYLPLTRPDITYVVNTVSRFIYVTIDVHMYVAEMIVGYLKMSTGRGLVYTKQNEINIKGFFDVDWVGSVDSRWLTIWYCVFLGDNLII